MSFVCSIYIFLNNTCKSCPYWNWVQSAVTGEIWLDSVICCIWPKFLTQMSAAFANALAPSDAGLSCWSLAQGAPQPCPEVGARRERCSAGEGHWLQVKGSTSVYCVQLEVLCAAGEAAGSHSKGRGGGKHSWELEPTWNGRKFRSPFPPWPVGWNCLHLSYAASDLVKWGLPLCRSLQKPGQYSPREYC